MNRLRALCEYGQSVWLDYIRRGLITSGELQGLVDEDGLRGITSNPAIFEKAITGSTDYAEALTRLERQRDLDAKSRYEQLAIRDIQDAADLLRPVYEQTKRRDGFVSLEVSPYLSQDTQATMDEARRLWKIVGRPNVMIKVPGTPEGIPAVTTLIGEGININVTLLFSQQVYEQVAGAYIAGLEALVARGGDPGAVSSVASFFISRIDTAIDIMLSARLKSAASIADQAMLQRLLGKVAIANGKLTYQRYKAIFSGERWQALARQGAYTQRVLWASTSTKNPNYRDVIYVEELIGPDTVNTIPSTTLEAFRDHGQPRPSLEEDIEGARNTMVTLEQVGISMAEVTDRLLNDGVQLFAEAFDKLLLAVDKRCQSVEGVIVSRQTYALSDDLAASVRAALEAWRVGGKVRRLWARDATLWTGTDEGGWLGWLGVAEDHQAVPHLRAIAEEVRRAKFSHALLLGMGGSSLCPQMVARTFGRQDGYPELHILDSTDPAQIRAFERNVDLANTIFIVSSKSGTTLEPNIFTHYFFERVGQVIGTDKAGSRFIAITDPGSTLQQLAERLRFRHILYGLSSIGGRYSALSDFGLAPAMIMGVDAPKLLDRAEEMAHACASCVPVEENPGVVLGTILGMLATHGRDKVTIIASPGIRHFGAWLEQLLAESTGKVGKGLIPVDGESVGSPEVYGADRVFVYLKMTSATDPLQDAALEALERAGQPVIRISLADPFDLGAEFFRWEIATAVAGSILGINPFNQPDVEASKVATRQLMADYERTGSLTPEVPILQERGITLFSDERNAAALEEATGADRSLVGYLRAHLNRLGPGDYFALLAYIEMNDAHERALQLLRHAVRDNTRVATCVGFGPRFLHSTGQAYKGGPNTGVFLQITCDDALDLPVPGHRYSFGIVKAAQARGDLQVLAERNRRALRVHLGSDVETGLVTLHTAIQQALR
ncbi:MAG: bifunctional transaldolase/phosoglucose isomerase [candidate division NC10 bacterium]|nr:bifunctional transaldolase/phosoglucose isomerase [candidate division NC10 bacterium]MDE2321031.1 bifunctional transaldolase/phosoglucose isomerase [candidate division NC10 bacterium]